MKKISRADLFAKKEELSGKFKKKLKQKIIDERDPHVKNHMKLDAKKLIKQLNEVNKLIEEV